MLVINTSPRFRTATLPPFTNWMHRCETENKLMKKFKPWKKGGRLRGQKKQVVAAVEDEEQIKVVVVDEVAVGAAFSCEQPHPHLLGPHPHSRPQASL